MTLKQIIHRGTKVETRTRKCAICGAEIEYRVMRYKKVELGHGPNICRECERANALELQRVTMADNKQARADRWFTLCPPLYQESDESRFPQQAWDIIKRWEVNPQGLLVHGVSGTCKTRMVWVLLKRLYHQGASFKAFQTGKFGLEYGAKKLQSLTGAIKWLEYLGLVDVLFIDDIGKAKFTETLEEGLSIVVENRVANLRPIIITMNLTGQGLKAKLDADRGEPLVRRLREFCEMVNC